MRDTRPDVPGLLRCRVCVLRRIHSRLHDERAPVRRDHVQRVLRRRRMFHGERPEPLWSRRRGVPAVRERGSQLRGRAMHRAAAVRAVELRGLLRREAVPAGQRVDSVRPERRTVRKLLLRRGMSLEPERSAGRNVRPTAVQPSHLSVRLLRCVRRLPGGRCQHAVRALRQPLPELRAAGRAVLEQAVHFRAGRGGSVQCEDVSLRMLRCVRLVPAGVHRNALRHCGQCLPKLRVARRPVPQSPVFFRSTRLQRADLSVRLLRCGWRLPDRPGRHSVRELRRRLPRLLASRRAMRQPAMRPRAGRGQLRRADLPVRLLRRARPLPTRVIERGVRLRRLLPELPGHR